MITNKIRDLMSRQPGHVERGSDETHSVTERLRSLGVEDHEQLRAFFSSYKLSGVLSNRSVELLDLSSPSPQIGEATDFGRDTYEINDDFICLTSGEGEGEGFLLYSKLNRKIYDAAVSELDALESGEKEATWETFYDLVEWYLG